MVIWYLGMFAVFCVMAGRPVELVKCGSSAELVSCGKASVEEAPVLVGWLVPVFDVASELVVTAGNAAVCCGVVVPSGVAVPSFV